MKFCVLLLPSVIVLMSIARRSYTYPMNFYNKKVCALHKSYYRTFDSVHALMKEIRHTGTNWKLFKLETCDAIFDKCENESTPVCAYSDEVDEFRTFNNECQMKKEIYKTEVDWKIIFPFACPSLNKETKVIEMHKGESKICAAVHHVFKLCKECDPTSDLVISLKNATMIEALVDQFSKNHENNTKSCTTNSDSTICFCLEDPSGSNDPIRKRTASSERATKTKTTVNKRTTTATNFNIPTRQEGRNLVVGSFFSTGSSTESSRERSDTTEGNSISITELLRATEKGEGILISELANILHSSSPIDVAIDKYYSTVGNAQEKIITEIVGNTSEGGGGNTPSSSTTKRKVSSRTVKEKNFNRSEKDGTTEPRVLHAHSSIITERRSVSNNPLLQVGSTDNIISTPTDGERFSNADDLPLAEVKYGSTSAISHKGSSDEAETTSAGIDENSSTESSSESVTGVTERENFDIEIEIKSEARDGISSTTSIRQAEEKKQGSTTEFLITTDSISETSSHEGFTDEIGSAETISLEEVTECDKILSSTKVTAIVENETVRSEQSRSIQGKIKTARTSGDGNEIISRNSTDNTESKIWPTSRIQIEVTTSAASGSSNIEDSISINERNSHTDQGNGISSTDSSITPEGNDIFSTTSEQSNSKIQSYSSQSEDSIHNKQNNTYNGPHVNANFLDQPTNNFFNLAPLPVFPQHMAVKNSSAFTGYFTFAINTGPILEIARVFMNSLKSYCNFTNTNPV